MESRRAAGPAQKAAAPLGLKPGMAGQIVWGRDTGTLHFKRAMQPREEIIAL